MPLEVCNTFNGGIFTYKDMHQIRRDGRNDAQAVEIDHSTLNQCQIGLRGTKGIIVFLTTRAGVKTQLTRGLAFPGFLKVRSHLMIKPTRLPCVHH